MSRDLQIQETAENQLVTLTNLQSMHQRLFRANQDTQRVMVDARSKLTEAKETAAEIAAWAAENSIGDLVDAVNSISSAMDSAWEVIGVKHRLLELFGAVDANAFAVIDTQMKTIESLSLELEGILNAINGRNTLDKRLEPIVDAVHEQIETDAAEAMLMYAEESIRDSMLHVFNYVSGGSRDDAVLRFFDIVHGDAEPTDFEVETIARLVHALELGAEEDDV